GIFITNWHLYTINPLGQYNIILYYTNNVIALFTTLVLLKIKTNIHLEKILKWFGDLAYPIFLCQYFGGFLAWLAIGGE
ncbi:acyltransferase, partial [Escherichia coli]|nr:acyltransferase [Escherichia coli]